MSCPPEFESVLVGTKFPFCKNGSWINSKSIKCKARTKGKKPNASQSANTSLGCKITNNAFPNATVNVSFDEDGFGSLSNNQQAKVTCDTSIDFKTMSKFLLSADYSGKNPNSFNIICSHGIIYELNTDGTTVEPYHSCVSTCATSRIKDSNNKIMQYNTEITRQYLYPNETVTIQCNTGYGFEGGITSNTSVCLGSGLFTFEKKCIQGYKNCNNANLKQYSNPTLIDITSIDEGTTKSGDYYTPKCNEGYNTPSTPLCLNGNWYLNGISNLPLQNLAGNSSGNSTTLQAINYVANPGLETNYFKIKALYPTKSDNDRFDIRVNNLVENGVLQKIDQESILKEYPTISPLTTTGKYDLMQISSQNSLANTKINDKANKSNYYYLTCMKNCYYDPEQEDAKKKYDEALQKCVTASTLKSEEYKWLKDNNQIIETEPSLSTNSELIAYIHDNDANYHNIFYNSMNRFYRLDFDEDLQFRLKKCESTLTTTTETLQTTYKSLKQRLISKVTPPSNIFKYGEIIKRSCLPSDSLNKYYNYRNFATCLNGYWSNNLECKKMVKFSGWTLDGITGSIDFRIMMNLMIDYPNFIIQDPTDGGINVTEFDPSADETIENSVVVKSQTIDEKNIMFPVYIDRTFDTTKKAGEISGRYYADFTKTSMYDNIYRIADGQIYRLICPSGLYPAFVTKIHGRYPLNGGGQGSHYYYYRDYIKNNEITINDMSKTDIIGKITYVGNIGSLKGDSKDSSDFNNKDLEDEDMSNWVVTDKIIDLPYAVRYDTRKKDHTNDYTAITHFGLVCTYKAGVDIRFEDGLDEYNKEEDASNGIVRKWTW
mgnify:CR=1 FL=1